MSIAAFAIGEAALAAAVPTVTAVATPPARKMVPKPDQRHTPDAR